MSHLWRPARVQLADSAARSRDTAAGAGADSVATMLTPSAVVALALLAAAAGADDAVNRTSTNDTLLVQPAEVAEKYFINKIFDKYGDKGVITFEVRYSYNDKQ